jgi:rhodanese-related sulfurtransferase
MKKIILPAVISIALLAASTQAVAHRGKVRQSALPPSKQEPAKPAEIERITAEELKLKLEKNEPVTIIDARSKSSYGPSDKKIKGAIRVAEENVAARSKDIPRDKEVVIYCACPDDGTSVRVARHLLELGYKQARALKGGWNAWLQANGPVESKPKL